MSSFYIILAVLAIVVLWVIMTFNGLVRSKNRVDEAFSDIDVQLKRRYDLIPNLVETVKGYAAHEKGVFENVTKARAQAMGAQSPAQKAEAENVLSGTLKSLFAVAENYPQLRAAENFMELQRELTDTEDKIQASRRFYNGNVRDFNIKLEVFPDMIIANMLAYKKREFFEIANAAEKEPVQVKF